MKKIADEKKIRKRIPSGRLDIFKATALQAAVSMRYVSH
jgi:hypothetical protein